MEKDIFPFCADTLPLADRTPRSEFLTDGDRPMDHGCGCGCGESSGNDHHERKKCHDNTGNCTETDYGSCPKVCVGYEGCGDDSWGLADHPLAMVYAPCQMFRALYDPDTALNRGTLFTELDLPLGGESCGFITVGDSCRVERRRR